MRSSGEMPPHDFLLLLQPQLAPIQLCPYLHNARRRRLLWPHCDPLLIPSGSADVVGAIHDSDVQGNALVR